VHSASRARSSSHTFADTEDFKAEKDEDNGYKKPAGPGWRYVGGLIGFVIAMSIFWDLVSHHEVIRMPLGGASKNRTYDLVIISDAL
jgi:hypothetical protein